MHFQTLLYVPLSLVFANDVLCYNLIRTFAFLLTGAGDVRPDLERRPEPDGGHAWAG